MGPEEDRTIRTDCRSGEGQTRRTEEEGEEEAEEEEEVYVRDRMNGARIEEVKGVEEGRKTGRRSQ